MNSSATGGDGKQDDESALAEFLSSLMGYTPTIPDELVEHYLARKGFQCPDLRFCLQGFKRKSPQEWPLRDASSACERLMALDCKDLMGS